jgi:hypothetical protein
LQVKVGTGHGLASQPLIVTGAYRLEPQAFTLGHGTGRAGDDAHPACAAQCLAAAIVPERQASALGGYKNAQYGRDVEHGLRPVRVP